MHTLLSERGRMKLAIMQPYLFPYLGYFQLIQAVDVFVIYDDVHYIKGGWINRNKILLQNKAHLFTLNVLGASSNRLINEVQVGNNQGKLLKTLHQSYAGAPQFDSVFPIIEEILLQPEKNLAKFLAYGLRRLCGHLGLIPQWRTSSSLKKDNSLRGQDKVIAICEELGATDYINSLGGKYLYSHDDFTRRGIRLSFIQPLPVTYRQFDNPFVPNLSIIDTLMFNPPDTARTHILTHYELV